ncbi:hypothetical protein [Enterobacter sp. R4-368]|uniref:hypothetical protein n=1 Tax=Enterobacter sp. R4-368 TaxID=1166130 RepID=UPI00034F0E7F|nr:hypothetical protein [Enterobacter sp. R4-368]AGN86671.1 hypothetical protein H650_16625 [Enterobacter sp. R4-368]
MLDVGRWLSAVLGAWRKKQPACRSQRTTGVTACPEQSLMRKRGAFLLLFQLHLSLKDISMIVLYAQLYKNRMVVRNLQTQQLWNAAVSHFYVIFLLRGAENSL